MAIKKLQTLVDMERFKESLQHTGQRMLELSKALSSQKASEPITDEERHLIRVAMYPVVKGYLEEITLLYLAGKNTGHLLQELEELGNFIQDQS